MTSIEKFIHDAVAGGWKTATGYKVPQLDYGTYIIELSTGGQIHVFPESVLLDPAAWEAVGKERVWSGDAYSTHCDRCSQLGNVRPQWEVEMIMFVNSLIDGESIEESLESTDNK